MTDTLTEPEALKIEAEAYKYPNGMNISCFECYNGSIEVTTTRGVPPYTYVWDDGITTEDRSGLGARNYLVKLIDGNRCKQESTTLFLKQPDSDDWK